MKKSNLLFLFLLAFSTLLFSCEEDEVNPDDDNSSGAQTKNVVSLDGMDFQLDKGYITKFTAGPNIEDAYEVDLNLFYRRNFL